MPSLDFTTETVIFHVRDGVDLSNMSSKTNDSLARQTFRDVLRTSKTVPGHLRQYHGHIVEHPKLFVYTVDWESVKVHDDFAATPGYGPFMDQLKEIFDFEAGVFATWARWSEDPLAAMTSPITEVAYFTLSHPGDQQVQQAKAEVEKALEPIMQNVQKVGKAKGAAVGWVERKDGSLWIDSVFGYDSIETHMEWRKQPEHDQAGEIFEKMEKKGLVLKPADVPGLDPETGYFHVKFEAGP